MEQFNRPNTRSQDSGNNNGIENMRHQDISFSEPATISPVTVASADLQTASHGWLQNLQLVLCHARVITGVRGIHPKIWRSLF